MNNLKKKPQIKFISNLVLRENTLFKKIKDKINIKNIYHIDASYLWGRKKNCFNGDQKQKTIV
jgi:hypothetical protein